MHVYFFVIGTNPARTRHDEMFVKTISEMDILDGIRSFDKPSSYDKNTNVNLLLSIGCVVSKTEDLRVYFLFESADQFLKDTLPPFLEVAEEGYFPMLGYVILADSEYLDLELEKDTKTVQMTMARVCFGAKAKGWLYMLAAKEKVQSFKQIAPDASFIVAVLNQDTPNAMPLDKVREELELDDSVKLVPCDPENKTDVKHVLLELLNALERTPTIEQVIDTIRQA